MRRPALRVSPFIVAVALAGGVAAAAQEPITATVVDQNGGAMARVPVRLVGADGRAVAQGFTDPRGIVTFGQACDGCRLAAWLPGFEEAVAPVNGTTVQLVLGVGPIREAVVVSATRGEAPVSQVGSAVTVFDAERIEQRGTPLVSELLRSSPGVAVARVGGLGNVTSMFVRGGESSYNKVLLDGIPLNEPGGTFDFSNLTTEGLERVEVLRGAHSALFGSDAMASVVQLVSKRATRPSALAAVEAGGYDTTRFTGSAGTSRGASDVSVHGSRVQTDNRAPNNRFRNSTLGANGGVQLTPALALRFIGRAELGHAGSPGATAFGRPDMDAFYERRLGTGGLTMQYVGGAWQQRATYAVTASKQESTNLFADPPYTPAFDGRSAPFEFSDFPYDSVTDLRRHYASYQVDRRFAAAGLEHLMTGAIDWDGERATLRNRLAGTLVPAERNNVGAALQHQLLGRRFALTSGFRVEGNDSFGTAVVPRVSLALVAREAGNPLGETRVKASAGGGVKEPTVTQSFSPSPSFLGNPDLLPERARSVDAGVEQRLFDGRVKVEVVGFYGRFENIISTRTLSFTPFRAQYFNIGLTHARGTELSAEAAVLPGLTVRATHTFLDSEVTRSTSPANPVFAEGRWLFRRPRHAAALDVGWSRGAASIDVHGTFVGTRVDSDFASLAPPMLSNEGHATWDLRGAYELARPIGVFVRVDNLFDADFMDPLGYPAWRRVAHAGVRVRF